MFTLISCLTYFLRDEFDQNILIQVSVALHLGFNSWLDWRRETCLRKGKKKKVIVLGIGILMAANFGLFRSAILLKPVSYFVTAFLAFLKINDCSLWSWMSQMHPEGTPIDSPTENDKLKEKPVSKSDQVRGTQSWSIPGKKFWATEEGAELYSSRFVCI